MPSKELVNKIKKELIYIGILFAAGIIIFKIAFFKEDILFILKTVFAFFWIFVLPGFFIMYYWHEKTDILERVIIGIVLSAALMGVSSYYIGILGVHIKYHGFILPLFYLIVGVILISRK